MGIQKAEERALNHTSFIAEDLGIIKGGVPLLKGLHFVLPRQGLVKFIGPNGAGKTTLLRLMAGLETSFSGRLLLEGRMIPSFSRLDRARKMAYLPQGHVLHWPLKAWEIVALGRLPFIQGDPLFWPEEEKKRIELAMRRTDIWALAERRADTLSGGEKARLMLARVLATGAPILLADEPGAALDPRHQLLLMQILQEEAQKGRLVVIVSHDLTFAARLADEVLLFSEGCLVAQGAPKEVLTPENLAQTYRIRALTHEIEGESLLVPWALL